MRILLLEDNADLVEAITSRLKSKDFVVDITSKIQVAESALAVGSFDLALFDLSLPDGNSLALLQKLRRQGKTIPAIIITARDQISDRITGLEAGADDYLFKPFDLDEMIARIHTIMRRYEGNPNPVIKFGNIEIDQSGHQVLVNNVEVELTELRSNGEIITQNDYDAIPPAVLKKLTGRFVRATQLDTGSGIGLSIVEAILMQSNATLALRSPCFENGRGFEARAHFKQANQ